MKSSIVITLHGVAPDNKSIDGQDTGAAKYTIARSTFIEIASLIKNNQNCTIEEFVDNPSGTYSILTFDDGLISDYEEAFPVLLDKGLKATFFVTTENIGKSGYMNRSQINEMASHGMEIASHGLQHRYLVDLPESDARRELADSKENLQQLMGRSVTSFAPVGGHYLPWMIGFANDSGYRAFATMIPGRTFCCHTGSPLVIRRNHVQSHHQLSYISSLINGDKYLLTKNRIRYTLLTIPKLLLGMDAYDRIKRNLIGESH
ncbi:MAG: hypothetical protein CXR30_15305 [Geobacter sp.]|nr:MAG: hypothetical protein CXR30_15305 [Geobacter sp.]